MPIAGAAFVHNDNVVFIRVTPTSSLESISSGRCFSGAAGHVENRTLIRMRLTRRDKNNLQRQFTSFLGPPVLEYFVNSAAQFFFDSCDVAGSQRYSGPSSIRRRVIGARECSPNCHRPSEDECAQ